MAYDMKSDFYMRLLSDSSHQFFPGNVTSQFTTKLPNEVVLTGQWEVALCDIFYHRTWVNIATPEDGKCTLTLWENIDGQAQSYRKKLNIEAHLQPGSYATPEALISALYANPEKVGFMKRK